MAGISRYIKEVLISYTLSTSDSVNFLAGYWAGRERVAISSK
jgi:hypothetical protein